MMVINQFSLLIVVSVVECGYFISQTVSICKVISIVLHSFNLGDTFQHVSNKTIATKILNTVTTNQIKVMSHGIINIKQKFKK